MAEDCLRYGRQVRKAGNCPRCGSKRTALDGRGELAEFGWVGRCLDCWHLWDPDPVSTAKIKGPTS